VICCFVLNFVPESTWGICELLADRLDTLTAPAPCPEGEKPAAPALVVLKVYTVTQTANRSCSKETYVLIATSENVDILKQKSDVALAVDAAISTFTQVNRDSTFALRLSTLDFCLGWQRSRFQQNFLNDCREAKEMPAFLPSSSILLSSLE
jgi:hypothetical protein